MPTIGHLIIGILIPFLIYFALNEKYSIEIGLYFLAGSILPDTYTIILIFIYPDITKYISWNITHGFIAWIIWGFIFTVIIYFSFKRISKLSFTQIFFILLLAGWLHLGIDMMTQPVRIIGDFRLSISDFFIPDTILYTILGEQDFIIVFYIVFIVIPIILLIKCMKKGVIPFVQFVNKSEIDDWMRSNALKFLKNVSFDETYIREAESYQKDKKNIDAKNKLIGLIRSIK